MQRRRFIGLLGALMPGLTVTRGGAENRAETLTIQESPIAGFQYHEGEALWPRLAVGQTLSLTREPANRWDPRAVRIDWQGHKLGYLPRAENVAVAQMVDRGYRLSARIVRLKQDRSPWQRIRINVRVRS